MHFSRQELTPWVVQGLCIGLEGRPFGESKQIFNASRKSGRFKVPLRYIPAQMPTKSTTAINSSVP